MGVPSIEQPGALARETTLARKTAPTRDRTALALARETTLALARDRTALARETALACETYGDFGP